ncbi:hypothetical protein L1987_54751 [Smallanthus sonchifolius]|uniref:Uncharacterized protein n=1 Tax=Smallanthus sonchifolius TaxID=185202 RepID=A0ACB9E7L9_9ASTR|nr:hypothetical protein L1987_54751 [Smallanthus sonchifolius]
MCANERGSADLFLAPQIRGSTLTRHHTLFWLGCTRHICRYLLSKMPCLKSNQTTLLLEANFSVVRTVCKISLLKWFDTWPYEPC